MLGKRIPTGRSCWNVEIEIVIIVTWPAMLKEFAGRGSPLPLYTLKRLKRLSGPLLRCPGGGCGAIFVKGVLGKSPPK